MAEPPMLTVKALSAGYGGGRVLTGADFTLAEGECVALLGRNGTGKSTLLKAVMGLVEREATQLEAAGRDLRRLSPAAIARSGIGYVDENRRVFAELTVEENIRTGRHAMHRNSAGISGARREWSDDALYGLFPPLEPLRRRRAGLLSGGEQQMLAVARTLAGSPALLLLDEPSEGLAPVIVNQLGKALQRLRSDGVAMLLAEQNWRFTRALASRVLVLAQGRIVHEDHMAAFEGDRAAQDAYLGVSAG